MLSQKMREKVWCRSLDPVVTDNIAFLCTRRVGDKIFDRVVLCFSSVAQHLNQEDVYEWSVSQAMYPSLQDR